MTKCRIVLLDSFNAAFLYISLIKSGAIEPRKTYVWWRKGIDYGLALHSLLEVTPGHEDHTDCGDFDLISLNSYNSRLGVPINEIVRSRTVIRSHKKYWQEKLFSLPLTAKSNVEIFAGNSFSRNTVCELLPKARCFALSHGLSDEVGQSKSLRKRIKAHIRNQIELLMLGSSRFSFHIRQITFTRSNNVQNNEMLLESYISNLEKISLFLPGYQAELEQPSILILVPEVNSEAGDVGELVAAIFNRFCINNLLSEEHVNVYLKRHPDYFSQAAESEFNHEVVKSFLAKMKCLYPTMSASYVRLKFLDTNAPVEPWIRNFNPNFLLTPASTTLLYAPLNGFRGKVMFIELENVLEDLKWKHDRWRQETLKWEIFVQESDLFRNLDVESGALRVRKSDLRVVN